MRVTTKIFFAVLFALLLTIPLDTFAAGDRLAVAAEGSEANASISMRAARAPFYLIFDQNGRLIESLENIAAEASGGASRTAVEFLEQYNVGTLIAGDFGKKMLDALKEQGIKHVIRTGAVSDVIRNLSE